MSQQNLPSRVRCAHILLKHTGSRNPINRNNNIPVTRNKEEAIKQMKLNLEHIKRSEAPDRAFKDMAMKISECSSARAGGDLGFFTFSQMQQSFSEAAFALNVGEVSDIVDSASGIHLIYRIA